MDSEPANGSRGEGDGAAAAGPDRVAEVRHDLRNQLGHIMGFTELLRDASSRARYEESMEDLRMLEGECDTMISLVNLTLEPAMLQEGRSDPQALRSRLGRFGRLVREAVERLEGHARRRGEARFLEDLGRISASVDRLDDIAESDLESLAKDYGAGLEREAEWTVERFTRAGLIWVDATGWALTGAADPVRCIERLEELGRWFSDAGVRAGLIVARRFGGILMAAVGSAHPEGLQQLVRLGAALNGEARRRLDFSKGVGGLGIRAGLAVGALDVRTVVGTSGLGELWGEAVCSAARLAGGAPEGRLLMTASTGGLLGSGFKLEPWGEDAVLAGED